jgi:hypothetical protein
MGVATIDLGRVGLSFLLDRSFSLQSSDTSLSCRRDAHHVLAFVVWNPNGLQVALRRTTHPKLVVRDRNHLQVAFGRMACVLQAGSLELIYCSILFDICITTYLITINKINAINYLGQEDCVDIW